MADEKKADAAKADKTTNEPTPTGSPVTTATPGNEVKGSPVTTASGDKSQQPANAAPGPQSTKSLVPGATKIDGDAPKNPASDNTPDEDHGDAPELTRKEEAELEKMLDGQDERESSWNERPEYADATNAAKKLQKLVAVLPKDTPNEHTVWGAGGIVLTVGDLRSLVKVMPTS